jgi:opine dehydrogenase
MKDRIIKQYGESVKDTTNLRTVFATNIGYSTLKIPMKEVPGGVIPNVDGRLFWEDIPYGLIILKDIADKCKLKTPSIDKHVEWHQKFMGKKFLIDGKINKSLLSETGAASKYGIKTLDHLLRVSNFSAKL